MTAASRHGAASGAPGAPPGGDRGPDPDLGDDLHDGGHDRDRRGGAVAAVRRALGNPGPLATLLLLAAAVYGLWRYFGAPPPARPDDFRVGSSRVEVHPDPVPARPDPPARPEPEPAAPPPPTPREVALRPAASPTGTSSAPMVRSSGHVREAAARPGPGAPVASGDGAPRGGVTYTRPDVQGLETVVIRDLDRVLKPTSIIKCALLGAIDGTHEGDFDCVIREPVYAWDTLKRIALLKAGDPVTGTYRPLRAGQDRMLGLSAWAYTTYEGAALMVPLGGAPVTDDLGRTGMPGHTESRWMERIGNALIVDAALAAVRLPAEALRANNEGFQVNVNSSTEIVRDILQTTLHLPPVFKKNEGEIIYIRITKPIHFGDLRYQAVGASAPPPPSVARLPAAAGVGR